MALLLSDYVTDRDDATQGLVEALHALSPGDALHIGPGTYDLRDVPGAGLVVPAGATISGPGMLRRAGTTAYMLDVSAGGCLISTRFDLAAAVNYPVAIYGADADNTTVTRCVFTCSTVPEPNWTVHAILLSGSNVHIRRNRVDMCQIKADTGHAGPGVWIERNHITRPTNMGISCVSVSEAGVIRDVTVAGNYIEAAQSMGIYMGSDANTVAVGTMARVKIVDNTVLDIAASNAGIYVRPCAASRDLLIDRNLVDGVTLRGNTRAIAVEGVGDSTHIEGAIVSRNIVRTTDLHGIRIAYADFTDLIVSDNILKATRGLLAPAGATCTNNVETP